MDRIDLCKRRGASSRRAVCVVCAHKKGKKAKGVRAHVRVYMQPKAKQRHNRAHCQEGERELGMPMSRLPSSHPEFSSHLITEERVQGTCMKGRQWQAVCKGQRLCHHQAHIFSFFVPFFSFSSVFSYIVFLSSSCAFFHS